jgi:3-deoxy-D-manno-octulosonic-acid transferase
MSDTLQTDVEILKKEMSDVKSIHIRLEKVIEKMSDVSTCINKMLAVHEEKISAQEDAVSNTNFIVESRRKEFEEDIKEIHNRITKNNEELLTMISKQHIERTTAMTTLKSEIMAKVGTLEKWRWLMIGGSVVIGFVLHKLMNFQILIN